MSNCFQYWFIKESSDYEPCGDCGYDHSYEQQEAYDWHSKKEAE